MKQIDNNVSYILIPFQYSSNKGINEWNCNEDKVKPFSVKSNLFYGFVEALYKNVMTFEFDSKDMECDEIKLICFETGIGFLMLKYLEPNIIGSDDSVNRQANKIERVKKEIEDGTYKILNEVKEYIPKLPFLIELKEFNNKNVLLYNVIIDNMDAKETNILIPVKDGRDNKDNMIGEDEEIVRKYYCSSNQLSILSNIYYKSVVEDPQIKKKEEQFREKYEDSLLEMFILLQHERLTYLMFREKIVTEKNKERKIIKCIKKEILNLLSCYSYNRITEDIELHEVYKKFREILDLTDYESNLNDLVFRLNEELDKNNENKMTYITFFITVLGVISIVLDIIQFLK